MVKQNSSGIYSSSMRSMQVTPPASLALEKGWKAWLKFPEPRDPLGFCPCCWVLALVWLSRDAIAGGEVRLPCVLLSALECGVLMQVFFGAGL